MGGYINHISLASKILGDAREGGDKHVSLASKIEEIITIRYK